MTSRTPTSPRRTAGFTLIEVMISMALVLVLIIGINQVFKISADTVGTGLALSSKVRDGRAVQAVFYNELSHAVVSDAGSPAPFLIIDSRTQAAFKNAADRDGDLDGNPLTTDIDSNNVEGEPTIAGENISPAVVNNRAHRVDTLSFFARDLYRRLTGNAGIYVDDMSSNEAWITYGHMRVFNQDYGTASNIDNDNYYFGPGAGTAATNPKNFYANNWILGRVATLLVRPVPSVANGYADRTVDKANVPQTFWFLPPSSPPLPYQFLRPLGRTTPAAKDGTAASPAISISDARFDVAGTTINDFREILRNYLIQLAAGAAGYYEDWWDVLPSSSVTFGGLPGRFRCNPYPTRPMDSQKMAQTAPIMLNNCTQFIVEYAGDFLTQDPATGALIPNAGFIPPDPFHPDGAVDFYVEPNPATAATYRRIRWYGFPRDTTGDGRIDGWQTGMTDPNLLRDVVPLRDVMRTSVAGSNGYPFEKVRYNNGTTNIEAMPPRINYANPAQDPTPNGVDPNSGLRADNHYVCAWGPNDAIKPTMLRLVVRVDDPNGRLADGQTFEYVFNLK